LRNPKAENKVPDESVSRKRLPRGQVGLRVIGGSLKGLRLKVPPGGGVRPTLDRIRESLFSILGEKVVGSVVLDAFAGSGALGIEALSRGARHAVFCDERPVCVRTIQENLQRCSLTGRASVLRVRVPEGFPVIRKALAGPFDLVFFDPPYRAEGKERLLAAFDRFALSKEHARIVFEHARKDDFASVPAGFVLEEQRRYGGTLLTFFRHEPGEKRDDGR
jgi:16S rRNA (guanine966-N2)-methyltransferase